MVISAQDYTQKSTFLWCWVLFVSIFRKSFDVQLFVLALSKMLLATNKMEDCVFNDVLGGKHHS